MKRLILIDDPQDPDDASARAIDPFRRPRWVDAHAQARLAEPPMGEGTYIRECVECGFRFRTEDREACLCALCDADEAARYLDDGGLLQWQQPQFGRGRIRQ